MIDDTMDRIERRIREAPEATEETKGALLALLADLRVELAGLGEQDRARAADVVSRARVADEADEEEGELERAVKEFEATHPRVMSTLQAFIRTLSDAGV